MADIDLIVNFSEQPDAEAVLVHWIYDEGAAVRAGDIVAEAMMDKVTFSIEAPDAGYLVRLVEPNGVFSPTHPIGRIVQTPTELPGSQPSPQNVRSTPNEVEIVPATPAVRRYAKQKGVDLTEVAKALPNHRLTMADVDTWIAQKNPGMQPYFAVRRTLIERLTNPNALPTTLHRRVIAGTTDAPPLARIAWAVGQALSRHPKIHGWATAEGFSPANEVVMGIAAQTSSGLLVPVLRQQHTLDDWAQSLHTLRQALRQNNLAALDFSRPSFVLSNLGPMAIEYFTPRLMTPTVAILGIGAGNDTSFPVSLTFDHRALDGAEAAEFLVAVNQLLGSA